MNKFCPTCKTEKLVDEFYFKNKFKNIREYQCKECSNIYKKKHYQLNSKVYINRSREHNKKTRQENTRRLWNYYASHPCIICGENDPVVLEADHRDGEVKLGSISDLIHRGYTWKTIAKELEKCDIRCANCHRRRTAKQLGWYAYLDS